MSINLITYANQTVTPTNDAIIYEKAVDQNGIFYGCNVTVSGNNVNITGGYGIVCGREFVIESESIAVTLAPSVPLDGRLYVRLDLADADNPIQLLTAQGGTLPPLVQDDDVNYTNGVYEMELATFTVGVSALSDCVETFETITGSKEMPTEIADYVVEQGTSNGWTYRKWASGLIECFISVTSPSWGTAQTVGGVTRQTLSHPTPPAMVSMLDISASGTNSGAWTVCGLNANGTLYVGCERVSGSSTPAIVSIRLVGTWK